MGTGQIRHMQKQNVITRLLPVSQPLSENGHIRDNTEVVLYETTFAILTYRVEK
jgi:hypothetical protein